MKLSIVVPHHEEDLSVGKKLFQSIAEQRMIDQSEVEIILVNDSKNHAIDNVPNATSYTVPNGGVSNARNYGLKKAIGDYVMFCDFDDVFFSLFGLQLIFDAIDKEPQVITSSFIEESVSVDGKQMLVKHETDATFIHGKVFNRKWLLQSNIFFPDHINVHEDTYFVSLALKFAEKREHIVTPFYLWCWNGNSVCRKEKGTYILHTYPQLMSARNLLTEALLEKGKVNDALDLIAKTIFDNYYDMQKPEFNLESDSYYSSKALQYSLDYYEKYKSFFDRLDDRRKAQIMFVSRKGAVESGMIYENETFPEHINSMTEILNARKTAQDKSAEKP